MLLFLNDTYLSACNMDWKEGDSHGCGRPVMLSLNVLIFCLYYGLE